MDRKKFNYAPGIPGYGTEGEDGSTGLSGLSIFVSTYSGKSEPGTIKNRINNNKYLDATRQDLPGGREYKTGDFFIDSESLIYTIDLTSNNLFIDTGQKFTASSTVFTQSNVAGGYFDARYMNDWIGTNDDNTKTVDFVASNDTLGDYAIAIDDMYNIEANQYPHIFYSDLNPVDQDKYHPFSIYTSGKSNNRAIALLSEIKDPANNESDWHFGNLNQSGDLRSDANRYHLDFNNVIFKYDVSVNNSVISPLYEANPETDSWAYKVITDSGSSGFYRSSNGNSILELQNSNGDTKVVLRSNNESDFYYSLDLNNNNINNVDTLNSNNINVNNISGFLAEGNIGLQGNSLFFDDTLHIFKKEYDNRDVLTYEYNGNESIGGGHLFISKNSNTIVHNLYMNKDYTEFGTDVYIPTKLYLDEPKDTYLYHDYQDNRDTIVYYAEDGNNYGGHLFQSRKRDDSTTYEPLYIHGNDVYVGNLRTSGYTYNLDSATSIALNNHDIYSVKQLYTNYINGFRSTANINMDDNNINNINEIDVTEFTSGFSVSGDLNMIGNSRILSENINVNTIGPKTAGNNIELGTVNNLVAANSVKSQASDERLKYKIKNIDNAIEKVKKLTPITFNWNEKATKLNPAFDANDREVGVIAQQVEKVQPEAVSIAPFDDEKGKSRSGEKYLTVNEEKLVPLLIQAINELSEEVQDIKNKMNK